MLDEHPALQVLDDHRRNFNWTSSKAADGHEHGRAIDFLDDETIAARALAVRDQYDGYTREYELHFCPVCGHRSLVADKGARDTYGYGIVTGICGVYSYRQSAHATEDLNLNQEFESRWAHQ